MFRFSAAATLALAVLTLAGCQYVGMTPGKAISASATGYQRCTTQKVIAAGKAKDRLAQAEAACKPELDIYRDMLAGNGMPLAEAEASASKLATVTRSAITAAGIA